MEIDLENRSEISNYSLEELEQFRDEKGFIDLSRIGIKFGDDTREFVEPIPFLESRVRNMEKNGLSQINYGTDYFSIVKC